MPQAWPGSAPGRALRPDVRGAGRIRCRPGSQSPAGARRPPERTGEIAVSRLGRVQRGVQPTAIGGGIWSICESSGGRAPPQGGRAEQSDIWCERRDRNVERKCRGCSGKLDSPHIASVDQHVLQARDKDRDPTGAGRRAVDERRSTGPSRLHDAALLSLARSCHKISVGDGVTVRILVLAGGCRHQTVILQINVANNRDESNE
jgi:hypothetical protein